jgi:hypothetical protein
MGALERMKGQMKAIPLYRLDGTTTVDHELEAYAAVLDRCEQTLLELYRESFAATAESWGLKLFSKELRTADGTLAEQQSAAKVLFSLDDDHFTKCDMERIAQAAGLFCNVEEYPKESVVRFVLLGEPQNLTRSIRILRQFFPVHLIGLVDHRKETWETLDNRKLMWSDLDRKGLSWKQIDGTDGVIEI